MQITKIEQQKKRGDRVSVFIDDKFAFGLPGADALYHKLKEGDELSEDKYNIIIEELVLNTAKNKALNYLSYRQRSEYEMRRYLKTKDFGEDVICRVMDFLFKYKYLDDEQFAASYINDSLKLKKWGPYKIKAALIEKGISEEIIEGLLEDNAFDTEETLFNLLEKKFEKDQWDMKTKQKAFRYLCSKGFSYEDAETAINSFFDME